MVYAYFIENTTNPVYIDNSPLFKYLYNLKLEEDNIYIDTLDKKDEIKRLVNKLKPTDTLIVRSIRDTANNTTQLIRVLEWLGQKSIKLISILEPYYNYTELVEDIAIIDKYYSEKNRISGFNQARVEGRIGRPRNKKITEALRLYETKSFTVEQIKDITGVSPSTLYRALKEIDK